MPTIAVVTTRWMNGFRALPFIASLRNDPEDFYEAAASLEVDLLAQRMMLWPKHF